MAAWARQLRVGEPRRRRELLMFRLGERHDSLILPRERSAAEMVAALILDVGAAHERGVLHGLVCGEVSHEPSIAAGGCVSVDHEDAAGCAGADDDLPGPVERVDVARQQSALPGCPAPRDRPLTTTG